MCDDVETPVGLGAWLLGSLVPASPVVRKELVHAGVCAPLSRELPEEVGEIAAGLEAGRLAARNEREHSSKALDTMVGL